VELLYKKIADIVEQEAACLEEFLTLLVNQQKYLVDNDIESLRDGVTRQQEIISRIKGLEKNRSSLVVKYSDSNDLDPEDVTISGLARRADGAIADKLMELQNSLLSLHQKIEKAKRKNEFLIEHSMKYIEGTIKLIAEKSTPVNDYAPHNKQESLIVSRTV
jgi:FlgN protein